MRIVTYLLSFGHALIQYLGAPDGFVSLLGAG